MTVVALTCESERRDEGLSVKNADGHTEVELIGQAAPRALLAGDGGLRPEFTLFAVALHPRAIASED